MSKIVVGYGKAQVEIGPGLQAHVRRMLNAVAPKTIATLEDHCGSLVREARQKWPRRTGRSAEALDAAVRVRSRTLIEGVVRDPVPYVYWIRFKKRQGGKQVWKELVLKPGRKGASRLAEALAEDLRNAAEGR